MIQYTKDTDNIVTLTMDMAGKPVNIINHEIGQAFIPIIDHLRKEKDKGQLRGVILTSAKKNFLAGGALNYLYQATSPEEVFQFAKDMKRVTRDIERPGVPVVAAINGKALGSGFELALSCHHRIVIDDPNIKLGNPEVTLGIMPGAGGVIRLLWLLGLENAFHVLADGHQFSPLEAKQARIIDDLAEDHKDMMLKAREFILKNREGRRKWDTDEGRIPGGTARKPSIAKKAQLISAHLTKLNYNNFPAQQAILNTLVEGSKVDFDTACTIESRYYTNLLLRKEAKNMIKTFWYDFNDIKSGLSRPKGFGKFRPKKVGIIGAGNMGSGIALACATNGLQVIIKDVSKPVADKGRAFAESKLEIMLSRGIISEEEKETMLNRIHTTEEAGDFKECDLVIEAVFENSMVKTKVTKEAEPHLDEYALFATNTASIPIVELSKKSIRPQNFVGLHFFSPAEKVPLVEVVKGENTSEETISRAYDFAKAIRKTPIVVLDNPGFFAGRVQNLYILEGIVLLQEGYEAALIENLAKQMGMADGPLAMADDLSFELVMKYEKQAANHYGPKYVQHPAVPALQKMTEELHRFGKNIQKGFYDYAGKQRTFWPGLKEHFPATKKKYSREEITERLFFVQALESLWCLQEGIIQSQQEANLGSIYGWGFPPFKGGVIQFIRDYGRKEFQDKCNKFKEDFGPRFTVPNYLDQVK